MATKITIIIETDADKNSSWKGNKQVFEFPEVIDFNHHWSSLVTPIYSFGSQQPKEFVRNNGTTYTLEVKTI